MARLFVLALLSLILITFLLFHPIFGAVLHVIENRISDTIGMDNLILSAKLGWVWICVGVVRGHSLHYCK
jgi:ATP/ADP translocase